MTILNVKVTNSMKKDLKRMVKRQKSIVELEPIIETLVREKALPKKYKDHALSGNGGVIESVTFNRIGF